ncbi:MAG: tripartite tricarboxylate transporter substrate-binding protein, partial [Betaproteobacteria bacterium]
MKTILFRTLCACLALSAGTAAAQAWPAKPIRWIVPFSAGGPADVIARIVSPKLAERLGQPVVIDNRVGGNSNIGHEAAARSAPDGYTILYVVPNIAT